MRGDPQPYVFASMSAYVKREEPDGGGRQARQVEPNVRLVTRLVDEEEARNDRDDPRPGR